MAKDDHYAVFFCFLSFLYSALQIFPILFTDWGSQRRSIKIKTNNKNKNKNLGTSGSDL
jgi:hypothetical protein